MKLLASALLLGLAFMFYKADAQAQKTSSSLPYYCPDKPGVHYYADVITGCRAFHICTGSEPLHFLCPTGLIFNENAHVCDYPSNVECKSSSDVLRILGLQGERIPLNDGLLERIQADASIPSKIKTSSDHLREVLNILGIRLSDTKSESSLISQTKIPFDYSKYESTEPSYVDEDLVEMLIRRTEELENSGRLVASEVDNYVLPPASLGQFGAGYSEEMGSSEEVLRHIITHQASEAEKVKSTLLPKNVGLLKSIVKPILAAIISDRSTLINIKRALLSALVELKPIVVELLRMRTARAKRSVDELSTVSSTLILKNARQEFLKLQEGALPELEGSELSTTERKTIQKFEEIRGYFQEFFEAMSSDKEFSLSVIHELTRIIEKESILNNFKDLVQFSSSHLRRKRFIDLGSPIVLPREIVEKVKAGLTYHTKPIIKDVLAATLPAVLRVASDNVPQILDIIESLKPLMKERFPTLLQHTASLVTKYERNKYSNRGHITLPPLAEMLSDFLPYALAGLEIGGEYVRKNPQATSALLFGKDGILSQILSTSYRPSLTAVQQQRVPVRISYQQRASASNAQYHNAGQIASRLAAMRRG